MSTNLKLYYKGKMELSIILIFLCMCGTTAVCVMPELKHNILDDGRPSRHMCMGKIIFQDNVHVHLPPNTSHMQCVCANSVKVMESDTIKALG